MVYHVGVSQFISWTNSYYVPREKIQVRNQNYKFFSFTGYRKSSILVFAIALVVACSTILLTVTGIINLVADIRASSPNLSFKAYC
jgi:hypothetical protein